MANTEDVGERFAEEARRIHYGETAARHPRPGHPEEREALRDEGIEVMSMPLPRGAEGPGAVASHQRLQAAATASEHAARVHQALRVQRLLDARISASATGDLRAPVRRA
jgi:hypothetical protein